MVGYFGEMSDPRPRVTFPDQMAQAVSLHREGRLAEAESAYRVVLLQQPNHVEALHLLGLVLHRCGRSADGLSLMDRALAIEPTLAPAWSNRSLALRALGRLPEAAQSLERALALRPELTEAWLNLARLRLALGAREAAIEAAREAARRGPEGLRLLAALLCEAGRWAEAGQTLERALASGPVDGRSLALLAQCWQEAGDVAAAERAWRRAVALPAVSADLLGGLGALLLREGRAEEAVPWLQRAATEAPEEPRYGLALADAITQVSAPTDALRPALVALLGREGLDHQRLDRAVRACLQELAAPLLTPTPDPDGGERAAEALSRDPLFLASLTRLQLQHPDWERALARLSALALRRAAEGRPLARPLVEGLGAHAWNTEHVGGAPQELVALAETLQRLPAGEPESWPDATWDRIAASATALPLDPRLHAPLLALGWERRPLAALVRQQLAEPAAERARMPEILSMGVIADPTSAEVQAMYEENPYPRLVGLHRRPPTPLGALLRATLRRPDLSVPWEGPIDVLVAGCGTGQHALSTATRTAEARVLAVDLSRASLARAQRLAEAAGLTNTRFAQADILALDALEARFHVVESVGVLHHLADPAAGLRVLRDRLLPGGLMQIGLYSERGRREVVAARALIAERGWPATPDGVREARRALMALPDDHPARPVVWSPDFYSVSGCRDLLFHVCEHRFTPLQLGELLDQQGLELLGFQHARPETALRYRERFPEDPNATDLARWDKLEDEHPRLFSGMLVFWCRVRG